VPRLPPRPEVPASRPCVRDDDDLIWFWIGSHSDYDQLIASL
jgi:hypothetical protein